MASERGVLIVVEGIDGAGKTTQVDLLEQALRKDFDVVRSREPTDGPWGRRLRESAQAGRLGPEQELEAFLNDRREHVQQLIEPALSAGKVVLLDRYFYSTIAYQGARGLDVAELNRKNREIAPQPDMVLLLDFDPDAALHRIRDGRQETPNEFERSDYLRRVRAIFLQLAADHTEIVTFDATRPIEETQDAMLEQLYAGPLAARR